MSEFTIEQWVDALGATKHGSEWRAACPVHDPDGSGNPDLDITKKNGRILCTCRVCGSETQSDVYDAARAVVAAHVNGAAPTVRARPKKRSTGRTISRKATSPLDWYSEYTQVPREVWEALGCTQSGGLILFNFPGVDARKKRKRGSRDFEWDGLVRPPLWPLPEETLPNVVALTEGESDCGVLRHLGFHAFTTTKGAAATGEGGVNADVVRALHERGAERILVISDADSKGEAFRTSVVAHARSLSLPCAYVDLSPYCDVTRGEKDARSVYLRHGRAAFLKIVKRATIEVETREYVDSFEDVLAWADEDEGWLVEGLVAQGTKTLLAAPAKSLKTYLILHLIAAGATCTPLLGIPHYRITRPLRTLLVEEEGSRPAFGRRLRRVFNGIDGEALADPQFQFRRGFNLLDATRVSALIEHVRENRIDVLILDPLQRITPGVEENSNSDMRRVWDAINRILLEVPEVAVVVVHHTRKGDALSPESSRGAGSALGEYDLGVFLKKNDDYTKTETTYQGTLALTLDGREHPQEYTKEGGALEVEYRFDYSADAFTMRATGEILKVNVRPTSRVSEFIAMHLQNAQAFVPTTDLLNEAQRVGIDVSTRESVLKHLRRWENEGRVVAEVRAESHGEKAWKWVEE